MSVRLDLSEHEALVFFDWLKTTRPADVEELIHDPAEQRVLWNLEAEIEMQLGVVLSPDYELRVARARARVRNEL